MTPLRYRLCLFVLLIVSRPLSARMLSPLSAGDTVAAASLKIALLSDIHYLSPSLVDQGEALRVYEHATGRRISDQYKVLDRVWDDLVKEHPDLLLIAGDLTHHGERQSHLDLVAKLRTLEEKGIRVLVVPGNHDINIPNARSYRGDKVLPAESITKEDFAAWYAPFGYGDALQKDDASLSYLAALGEKTWLLCFDSNRYDEHTGNSVTAGRIRPQTMQWARSILRDAKEKGITVLGMMHHGLVEHLPYQSAFFSDYLVEEWEHHAEILADAGMRLIFTGHFHANDITRYTSPSGNNIYDIETASLAQYPFAWRIMTLDGDCLRVDSRFVTSLPDNDHLEEESRQRLETVGRRVAEARLKGLGFPLPDELLSVLTDLVVKLYLMHVRGDETPDPELLRAVRTFASLLGNEADMSEFSFDFPPEDNRVAIRLKGEGER